MKTISDIKTAINNNAERISDLIARVEGINQYINETSERATGLEIQMQEANRRIIALTIRDAPMLEAGNPDNTLKKKIEFLTSRGNVYKAKWQDALESVTAREHTISELNLKLQAVEDDGTADHWYKQARHAEARCEDLTKTLAETEQQLADWKHSFKQEQGNADRWCKDAQASEIKSKDWEAKYHEMVQCRDQWRVKWNQADNASKEWEEECDEWEDKYDEMKKQAYEWERRFHALSSDMTGTCSTLDQLRAENERLQKVINSINSLIQ